MMNTAAAKLDTAPAQTVARRPAHALNDRVVRLAAGTPVTARYRAGWKITDAGERLYRVWAVVGEHAVLFCEQFGETIAPAASLVEV